MANTPGAAALTGSSQSTAERVRLRRRLAFRVVAVCATGVGVAFYAGGLAEIVLMWLPDDVVASVVDDPAIAPFDHRAQFFHVGIVSWAILPAVALQLWRPERHVAPMLQAAGVVVATLVVMVAGGVLETVDLVVVAVVALLVWLHPCVDQLLGRPRLDEPGAWVVLVGLVLGLAYAGFAVAEARSATGEVEVAGVPEDVLWAHSALVPIAVAVVALVGCGALRGWRISAWAAVVGGALIGVHALAYPAQAASMPWWGAVVVLAWAVLFAWVTIRRSRGIDREGVEDEE